MVTRSRGSQAQTRPTGSKYNREWNMMLKTLNGVPFDEYGEVWCKCKTPKLASKFETKKPGPNQGREFYRCPSQDKSQDCRFFLWVDVADNIRREHGLGESLSHSSARAGGSSQSHSQSQPQPQTLQSPSQTQSQIQTQAAPSFEGEGQRLGSAANIDPSSVAKRALDELQIEEDFEWPASEPSEDESSKQLATPQQTPKKRQRTDLGSDQLDSVNSPTAALAPTSDPFEVISSQLRTIQHDQQAWKYKYDQLQAKYDADHARWQTDLRRANEEIATLRKRRS